MAKTGTRFHRRARRKGPDRLRQGYGGPPKLHAKAEGLHYDSRRVASGYASRGADHQVRRDASEVQRRRVVDHVLGPQDSTLVDVLDHLLNKGVMATGDVTLGVAGIDLIYLRLSALLCAADRVLPRDPNTSSRPYRHRQPGRRTRT